MSKPNHIVEPEELMAYLDGELPAEQAIDTAAHLESCRECQRLAADLKEVSEMMMDWEMEAAKPELGEELEAALGDEPAKQRRSGVKLTWQTNLLSPRGLVWAGGLAVVVLIILASNLMRWQSPAPPAADLGRVWPAATPQAGKGVTINGTLGSVDGRNRGMARTVSPAPAGNDNDSAYNNSSADRIASISKFADGTLVEDSPVQGAEDEQEKPETPANVPANNGPMIVRTAELEVTTKDFDKVRSNVEEILKRHHGYVGEMNVNTPTGSARSLTASLRVPADGLDPVLADLKHLGRTEKESQTGEEVTQQYVDLQARLANAKHTEQRLADILRERTGKLSDVLAVELQIGRVRGEIEQMEAQRKNMKNQVDYATLNVTVTEDYKAELKVVPPSTSTQFRNAAVEGYRSLVDGIISVLLWLLSAGPTLLVWAAILFFPVRIAWKKLKPKWQSAAGQNP